MDASAYLRNQGWRGDGHSLDHTNRGIKKPLLVAKKVDYLGVGNDKHATLSNQWWLRAFDQGLKKLGTGEESVLASVQKHGVKRGALYSRFVKGERIAGSIGQSPVLNSPVEPNSRTSSPLLGDRLDMGVNPLSRDKVVEDVNGGQSSTSILVQPGSARDAPADMTYTLDKKRKRAETSENKRTRQKTEHNEESDSRKGDNSGGMAVRASKDDRAKKPDEQAIRNSNRRASAIVEEAQRCGVLPTGPDKSNTRSKKPASATRDHEVSTHASQELREIVQRLGWDVESGSKATRKPQMDKYAREKMKRELKRAAREYFMGDEVVAVAKKTKKTTQQQKRMPSTEQNNGKDSAKKRRTDVTGTNQARIKSENQRAIGNDQTPEEHHTALTEGEAPTPSMQYRDIPPGKLAGYQKRADEKGLTLDAYFRRREEKVALKLAEKAGEPKIQDANVPKDLGFVIDTQGDENLKEEVALDFEMYYKRPELAVPLDPRIWEGRVVKDLPKHIRRARRDWMAARRAEKKGHKVAGGDAQSNKTRAARKVEARETFVRNLLHRSRQAGGRGNGVVDVDNVKNVPLIKVETTNGPFSKMEMKLARTVARRTLRNAKRADREMKGRGKGHKKGKKVKKSKKS